MTPDRSLSSLNAHMNKTVEPKSDGSPMHFLRARIAHGAPELPLIHRPPKDEHPGQAWVFRSGDDRIRTDDPLLAKQVL
jgi:hypothetical protein